jgi:adenosylcobalamin-dependent ribonucleoside-triphosphate reductase
VSQYDDAHVPWGNTDAGGNSVGELTFIRTYSRLKEDGTKETWQEVCRRVIEGTYSIQKNHCKANRLPWNDRKAHASAEEAFDRMFNLKWTPPGRGLHQMGAPQVLAGNSASLQNCAVVGTGDIDMRNPGYVFQWGMEALMNGVGLGFDTLASERGIQVTSPVGDTYLFEVPDTREGWAESVGALVNSYLRHGASPVEFDYSLVRPAGAPIKTFGGTASGPEPLRKVHEQIRSVLESNAGGTLTSKTIVDIFNLIGTCVVAGNVRRSAEIALGSYGDDDFLELKNPEVFPERNSYDSNAPGWAWSSNNSINVPVGADYSQYIDKIVSNGEPGFIWLDVAKSMGRGKDGRDDKDRRVVGFNPCSEQPLESFEMCTLTTVHLQNHDSKADLLRTLKFAFLYAKTVTLLPTPWPRTNAVMQRNRRIGLSLTGITDVLDDAGMPFLVDAMESGYEEIRRLDSIYSEWLCVRESNRVTTIKPEGTVSILSGASPGIHWTPGGHYFLRAIRFSDSDTMLPLFRAAGYLVEDDLVSANTKVVYFPISSSAHRSEKDVTIFEKIGLAAKAQHHWSDNGVSVTVSFDKKSESDLISPALRLHEGALKAVSFLPMDNTYYPQMPYSEITKEEYESYVGNLKKIDFNAIYTGADLSDAEIEKYCTSDSCTI